MRHAVKIVAAVAWLGFAGGAGAQSGQGGYLGINPGKGVGVSTLALAPPHGSGQGGYLGLNPGAGLQPVKPTTADATSAPAAWCENSLVPSRCRARAAADHAWCAQRPERYAACRRTMDYMGWPP
jgi:hypothetical protein